MIQGIIRGLLMMAIINVSGAAEAGIADRLETDYVRHQEVSRQYHIFLPKHFKSLKNPPLIIALHGGGGRGKKFSKGDRHRILREADKHGIVVVFPEGLKRQWNDGRTEIYENMRRPIDPPDDVGFIERIIDRMIKEYGIDGKRVFATGISNGGFMSIRLALELSDRIRAIAPVTAQLQKAHAGLSPAHPISVMIINGTEDPLVPYDGGQIVVFNKKKPRGEIFSTEQTIKLFRQFNGCRGEPQTRAFPDLAVKDGTQVEEFAWTECKGQSQVILLKVSGGGHTWPGGRQYLPKRRIGRVSRDINATEQIVEFFMRQN